MHARLAIAQLGKSKIVGDFRFLSESMGEAAGWGGKSRSGLAFCMLGAGGGIYYSGTHTHFLFLWCSCLLRLGQPASVVCTRRVLLSDTRAPNHPFLSPPA